MKYSSIKSFTDIVNICNTASIIDLNDKKTIVFISHLEILLPEDTAIN